MLKDLSTQHKDLTQDNENKSDHYTIFPDVDIFETNDEFVLKAEIPGVDKKDLDISINEGNLIVKAKASNVEEIFSYQEYRLGEYFRSFKVADSIDQNKIKAELTNGILNLHLPKAEKMKPRKIKIET